MLGGRAILGRAVVSHPVSGGVDVIRQPGQARRAVRELTARHWVLMSSGNVYARFDQPDHREDAPLPSPLADDVMPDMSRPGEAKVACEEVDQGGTNGHTVIHAGLIGGDRDWSGHSGYYPWPSDRPGHARPTGSHFPVAMIDVEDLAAWIVDCARERVQGVFNATTPRPGPARVGRAAVVDDGRTEAE